jgi:hypothetical protein
MELMESSLSRVGSLEKPAILIQIPGKNYLQQSQQRFQKDQEELQEEYQREQQEQRLTSVNEEMSIDVPSSWTNNAKYKRTNVAITQLGSDF